MWGGGGGGLQGPPGEEGHRGSARCRAGHGRRARVTTPGAPWISGPGENRRQKPPCGSQQPSSGACRPRGKARAAPRPGVPGCRVFEQCHRLIPPLPFYQGCAFDHCHLSDPSVLCSGLELYASLCASRGVCIDWRNHTNHTCRECPPASGHPVHRAAPASVWSRGRRPAAGLPGGEGEEGAEQGGGGGRLTAGQTALCSWKEGRSTRMRDSGPGAQGWWCCVCRGAGGPCSRAAEPPAGVRLSADAWG